MLETSIPVSDLEVGDVLRINTRTGETQVVTAVDFVFARGNRVIPPGGDTWHGTPRIQFVIEDGRTGLFDLSRHVTVMR